jgi:putative endonuclease
MQICGRLYQAISRLQSGLVWYELHPTMEGAILREKQLKKWHRRAKLRLIETSNPQWRDLYEDLV